jgi:hypothetical protein
MAKKDKVQNFVPEQELIQEETLFEAEAYGNPQPDAGMETTVMKPVGMGGPVPIVAPKHNTIQLQPIVVPLAVVPYMSQDSDVLRTDGVQAQEYDTATGFSKVEAEKEAKARKKSKKAGVRAASFFSFLLSGVVVAIYLLAYFMPEFYVFNFGAFNVIGTIIDWIGGIAPQNMAVALLHIISAGFAGILVVISLISFIVGKTPAGFNTVLSFISAATVDAALIYTAVKATNAGIAFDVMEYLEYIILAGVATLGFIVSIIILVGLGRNKDPYSDEAKSNNVI